jgi:glycosyltransferase involved in cell wall biosynthesis
VVEVPDGVDSDHFCPEGDSEVRKGYRIPEEAKLILFVSALDRAHHFKRLDLLLQAVSKLPEDCWLLVVGDGDMRHTFEEQAASLGIAGRTVFAGRIDHHDLPSFYRCADLKVLPSSPPESFGLVLVESLACGTPVVASDIPGVRTVVDEGQDGFLVQSENLQALVTGLQSMLAISPEKRQRMGLAGRRKVEARYTWRGIVEQLLDLYETLLGNP